MCNLRNNEKKEIILYKISHILLKKGDNFLDLTARRLNIAKEEIEQRKLKIEIIEVSNEIEINKKNKEKTTENGGVENELQT